jgi:Fe2+ or Zn2+ uptake regulation protein
MSDKLIKEIEAFGLLQKLLQQADEVRRCFISAGLPLPGPIIRLLGNEEKPSKSEQVIPKKYTIQSPANRPEAAKDDWIAVKLNKLTAQDLVLAFLRDNAGSLAPKVLLEKIDKVKPGTQSGTVYNIGPRLIKQKILERNNDGEWVLLDPTIAPLIENEYAWGPKNIFSQQALAANRRERILQTLTEFPDGLTTMQIARSIKKEGVSFSKELAMCDMNVLHDKGVVKRSGKHKKWSIIDDKIKE